MAAMFEGNGIRLQQADDSGNPNDLLLTGFSFPDQPEHTIPAFVFKQTKDKVQNLAKSTHTPIVLDPTALPYTVSGSSIAGQGLMAAAELKTGDLIITERPLLVTRAEMPADKDQVESYLQILFARLPHEHQVQFSNLDNCKNSREAGPHLGRLRTNGFTFSPYPNSPPHAGIFPTFSRCNHSCGPSALAHFNYSTWAIELRATRTIKAGEEITISYVDVLQASLGRRVQLATTYNFTCSCNWCSLPKAKQAESNTRRNEIANRQKTSSSQARIGEQASSPEFLRWRNSSDFDSQPTELLKQSIGNIVAATKEGLEPFIWRDAMTLYKVYALLGDEKNFRRWRTTFRDILLANVGVTPELEIANAEIADPTTNKEWNLWTQNQSAKQSSQ